MRLTKTITMLLATLMLTMLANGTTSPAAQRSLPNPVIYPTTQEFLTKGGKKVVRYYYDVLNKEGYPAELFAPAPALPPCGTNAKSSRTWVYIFDQSGKQVYGFCAFSKPEDLGRIWFEVEEGVIPPSYVYIELNDRQTDTKYKSNLAETTL